MKEAVLRRQCCGCEWKVNIIRFSPTFFYRKLTIPVKFAYSISMISVHDALTTILDTVSPLAGERLGLLDAVGRVLAEEIRSEREVPPFANSAMDGYAVRWDDIRDTNADQPVTLGA